MQTSDLTFVQAILGLSPCQSIHFERSIVGTVLYIVVAKIKLMCPSHCQCWLKRLPCPSRVRLTATLIMHKHSARARERASTSARAMVRGKGQGHGSRAKAGVRLRPVTVASSRA